MPPAATAFTPVSTSRTGGVDGLVVLSASWPLELSPQHRRPPVVIRAQVWLPPTSMAATPESTSLSRMVERVVVVPSPSWPALFAPQHRTPPAVVSTHV